MQLAKDIAVQRAVMDQIEDEAERRALGRRIALMELKRGVMADARRRSARG